MNEINITEPSTAPTHRLIVTFDPTDTARDRQKARLRCRVPGCVIGSIDGSPAAWIQELVGVLVEHHAHTRTAEADTDDVDNGDFYWPVADQIPPADGETA